MAAAAPARRPAVGLVAGLAVLTAAAWLFLAWDSVSMGGAMPPDADATSPWRPGVLLALFVMWAVMMAAMMLPGAVPAVLLVDRLAAARRLAGRAAAGAGWFVAGYLGAWCLFSLAATVAQAALQAALVLAAGMSIEHRLPGAVVLAAAGVYQFLPIKGRCLAQCRSPLDFVMHHWREGRAGAAVMGLQHGAWCVGCCWLLMAVLFVVGVMNLAWVVLLTGFVVAEKLLPNGVLVGRMAGAGLLAWALALALGWI